jgi:hypothetical protein
MKPVTVAIAIAALALPLCAAEQQKPNTNTTTTTLSVPVTQEAQDSPLVRAAKATGRLNKKPGFVITNETLLRTGGHVGFSSQTASPAPLPAAVPAARPAQGTPKVIQPTRNDADAKQRAARQATSDYYGENLESRHDDPAMQEHQMQQATTPPAKPPQN